MKAGRILGESVLVFSLVKSIETLISEKGVLEKIGEEFIGSTRWVIVDPFFYSEKAFEFDCEE